MALSQPRPRCALGWCGKGSVVAVGRPESRARTAFGRYEVTELRNAEKEGI